MTDSRSLKAEFPAEYNSWRGMQSRCYKKSNPSFRYVGAKGVTVCERWRMSFADFINDMGPKPGPAYSIDRFPDNDGNYELSNCRWATKGEQARHRPGYNRRLTMNGVTRCVAEWARVTGISVATIKSRIERFGWPVRYALTAKPDRGKRPFLKRSAVMRLGPNVLNKSSGMFGVSYHKPSRKWQAKVRVGIRIIYLGHHLTAEAAAAAIKAKLVELEVSGHGK